MRAIELAEQLEYSALGNLGDFAYVADAAKELRRTAFIEIKLAAAEIELATANANLAALRGQEPVYASDNLEYSSQGMGCGLEDRGITDRYEAMQYGWDEAIESMDRAGPFYTAPVPSALETLDKPARVRGVVFGPGVKVITVIQAAQRCAEEYVPEDAPGIQQEILRGLHNLARPSAVELQAAEIGIPVPVTELINPA